MPVKSKVEISQNFVAFSMNFSITQLLLHTFAHCTGSSFSLKAKLLLNIFFLVLRKFSQKSWKFKSWAGKLLKICSWNKRYPLLYEEFENEKKKEEKSFDLPKRGFEPQIFNIVGSLRSNQNKLLKEIGLYLCTLDPNNINYFSAVS